MISSEAVKDKELFPDLPTGPFDQYRKRAKFDYRRLALIFDNERCLRFRVSEMEFWVFSMAFCLILYSFIHSVLCGNG